MTTRQQKLQQLAERVGKCTKCPLRETATQPIYGLGEVGAKYLIIGESPGKQEDVAGCPFVGSSGKRLDKLTALANIDMNDVYITNVIKCRPPKNRDPRKGEIRACVEWLEEEIRIVKPETIITLGRVPLSLFSPYSLRQMHGTRFAANLDFGEHNGITREKTRALPKD